MCQWGKPYPEQGKIGALGPLFPYSARVCRSDKWLPAQFLLVHRIRLIAYQIYLILTLAQSRNYLRRSLGEGVLAYAECIEGSPINQPFDNLSSFLGQIIAFWLLQIVTLDHGHGAHM